MILNSRLPRGQQWFIDRMQSLKYPVNPEGICFGLAYLAMKAFLARDMDSFVKHLELIHSIPEENFVETITRVREKKIEIYGKVKLETMQKMGIEHQDIYISLFYDEYKKEFNENLNLELNKKENFINDQSISSLLEISAFMDEVELFMQAWRYPHLFPKNEAPKIQNASATLKLLKPKALEEKGGAIKLSSFPGCYDQNELQVYLETLSKAFATADFPISFMIGSGNHIIHLGYDHEKKILVDANHLPCKDINVNSIMGLEIINALSKNGTAIFETEIYVAREHEEKAKELVMAWQQNTEWQGIHDIEKNNKQVKCDSYGYSYLHIAALNGHLDIVNELLDKGANANTSVEGETALHIAAHHGDFAMVKALLDWRADINASKSNGFTPLHLAAQEGYLEIVKELLARGAVINSSPKNRVTPLHLAASKGHLDIVKALLGAGANVNASNNNGSTPLHLAAQNGYFDIVKTLLDNNADINASNNNGATPLYIAAQNGHLDIVKELLGKVADINASNNNGTTSLHIAAQEGHLEIVKALLLKDANVNAFNNKNLTPLHIAALKGHLEIVKVLLDKNPKLDMTINYDIIQDYAKSIGRFHELEKLKIHIQQKKSEKTGTEVLQGFTPLHIAIFLGHTDIVRLLIEKGADIEKQALGVSPLELACAMDRPEIIQLISSYSKGQKEELKSTPDYKEMEITFYKKRPLPAIEANETETHINKKAK